MRAFSFSYRSRVIYIIIGSIIGVASLVFTRHIAEQMEAKEKHEIEMWARGFALLDHFAPRSTIERDLNFTIINSVTDIPVIVTDGYLRVITYKSIDSTTIENSVKLKKTLEKMSIKRKPIHFTLYDGSTLIFYYSDSTLLQSIRIYPYLQLGLIVVLISFAFITFRSSKQSEQNRVWVGMAKETAHQLGTPTSSLLGWIDYIKEMNILPEVTEEMSRDVERLMKVTDRFSKIGSTTQLVPREVYDVVAGTVNYFQTRMPRNVVLRIENESEEPLKAMINDSLFDWVIENLLKNALDALQGRGEINVILGTKDKWIVIDVNDTGRGMPKMFFQHIFKPGYSTKTRGWGLGLSLSRRIVEEYHFGKIFVKESEMGKGSTFRIMLKKL